MPCWKQSVLQRWVCLVALVQGWDLRDVGLVCRSDANWLSGLGSQSVKHKWQPSFAPPFISLLSAWIVGFWGKDRLSRRAGTAPFTVRLDHYWGCRYRCNTDLICIYRLSSQRPCWNEIVTREHSQLYWMATEQLDACVRSHNVIQPNWNLILQF